MISNRGNEIVLELENLCAGYGEKSVIVRGLSANVKRGEIVTLIGPNGAGKSTVLKTASGQIPPVSGEILIDGLEIKKMTPAALSKKVSVVSTERIRPELMTARAVAAQGRYPYTGRLGFAGEEDKKIVEDALRLLQCLPFADDDFNKLSDGQKQRVLIARAIAQTPDLMILDEPTSYLDIKYQFELENVLKKLAESGISILMSLHELGMAMRVSDRLIGIRGGEMAFSASPEQVLAGDRLKDLFDLSGPVYQILVRGLGSGA